MKQTLLLALALFFFSSCKKSELLKYQGGNNIYLTYANGPKSFAIYSSQQISVPYGKNLTATEYDVVFDVLALGNTEDRKRPFQLVVNTKNTTAIEGIHFKLPPVDSFYIGASKVIQKITVKILRPALLRDTIAFLELNLVANNEFQTRLQASNTGTLQSSVTTVRIVMEDKLPKPKIWDGSVNVLGQWSREKLEKMVLSLPANIDYFYTEDFPYTPGELTTLSKNMQKYLNTQKSLGKTVYEKDGSEMKMGPAVQ